MVISLLCGLVRSLIIEQESLLVEDGSKSSFEYYSVEENDALTGSDGFGYQKSRVFLGFWLPDLHHY